MTVAEFLEKIADAPLDAKIWFRGDYYPCQDCTVNIGLSVDWSYIGPKDILIDSRDYS
jgi:hypothetical protein